MAPFVGEGPWKVAVTATLGSAERLIPGVVVVVGGKMVGGIGGVGFGPGGFGFGGFGPDGFGPPRFGPPRFGAARFGAAGFGEGGLGAGGTGPWGAGGIEAPASTLGGLGGTDIAGPAAGVWAEEGFSGVSDAFGGPERPTATDK